MGRASAAPGTPHRGRGLGPTPECGYHSSAVPRGGRSTRAPLIGLRRRLSPSAACRLADGSWGVGQSPASQRCGGLWGAPWGVRYVFAPWCRWGRPPCRTRRSGTLLTLPKTPQNGAGGGAKAGARGTRGPFPRLRACPRTCGAWGGTLRGARCPERRSR